MGKKNSISKPESHFEEYWNKELLEYRIGVTKSLSLRLLVGFLYWVLASTAACAIIKIIFGL